MTHQAATKEPRASVDFFQPRRLGHVNLVVENVDRSMKFYHDIVGLHESYRQPLLPAGFLSNGNTHHDIGMVERSGKAGRGRPAGLNHIAFELETEVDLVEGYNRAIAAGVKFDRTMDHDIAHALYSTDPSGNHCEIYADVIKDWRNARTGVVTKPKPDWTPGSTPPTSERNYEESPDLVPVSNAIFPALRVGHATLSVEKFEETFDYYRTVVGLKPLVGGAKSAFAIFTGTVGEPDLALFRAGPGRPAGLHHFGILIGSEKQLDASTASCTAKGIIPELAVENDVRRSVFVKDPDGIRVQLYVDRTTPITALQDRAADVALFTT